MITCINALKKAWEIDFMGIYLATICHVSVSEVLKIMVTLNYESSLVIR